MEKTTQSYTQEYRFQLECDISEYSRYLVKERLKKEGIPISSETLDNVGSIYSEELTTALDLCMSNLIETDVRILKDIYEKSRRKGKEKGQFT